MVSRYQKIHITARFWKTSIQMGSNWQVTFKCTCYNIDGNWTWPSGYANCYILVVKKIYLFCGFIRPNIPSQQPKKISNKISVMKTKDMGICLMWAHLHTPRNDRFMNLLFFLRVMPFIFNFFSLKYATRFQDPIYHCPHSPIMHVDYEHNFILFFQFRNHNVIASW